MIRTVLFDAVGTLFDVAEPVGETYARFARREGVLAEPRALDDAFRAAFVASTPLAFPHAEAVELPSLERACDFGNPWRPSSEVRTYQRRMSLTAFGRIP